MRLTNTDNEIMLVTAVLTGLRKIGPSMFTSMYEGLGFDRNNRQQVQYFAHVIARCHTCGWISNPMDSHDGLTVALTEQGEAKADELLEALAQNGLDLN